MIEKHAINISKKPNMTSSTLIVSWIEDAADLGQNTADYLIEKLRCHEFAQIEPEGFFPLGGVSVDDDVAEFPESRFYCSEDAGMVIFKSSIPRADWYQFLSSILDVAEQYCAVKEIYTIGGMISWGPHTTPRSLMAVANSPEMKKTLIGHGLPMSMDFETPPGQRPTLNSFLMWTAQRRNLAGASLWVPVPFYLLSVEDPSSSRTLASFLDTALDLGIDFADLDSDIETQHEKLAQMRRKRPELDGYIVKIENNEALTREEGEKLVKGVELFFKQ